MISAQEKTNWTTYKNSQFGFSMLYPAYWNLTRYNTSLLDVENHIVDISGGAITGGAIFTIFAEELDRNMTVKEYARELYFSIQERSPFFERINDSAFLVDNIPAWKMEYKYNFPDFTGQHMDITSMPMIFCRVY